MVLVFILICLATLYLFIGDFNLFIFKIFIDKDLLLPYYSLFSVYLVAFLVPLFLSCSLFFPLTFILSVFNCFLIFFCISHRYFLCSYHGASIKRLIIITIYFKLITHNFNCIQKTLHIYFLLHTYTFCYWCHNYTFLYYV